MFLPALRFSCALTQTEAMPSRSGNETRSMGGTGNETRSMRGTGSETRCKEGLGMRLGAWGGSGNRA